MIQERLFFASPSLELVCNYVCTSLRVDDVLFRGCQTNVSGCRQVQNFIPKKLSSSVAQWILKLSYDCVCTLCVCVCVHAVCVRAFVHNTS